MSDFLLADKQLGDIRKKNELILTNREKEISEKIPQYDIYTNKIKMLNLSLIKKIKNRDKDIIEVEKSIDEYKKERENLLIKNGYSKDYLNNIYSCNICNDTGEINGKICNCKRKIINKIRLEKANMYQAVDIETFENFDLSIFRDTKNPDEIISPRKLMEMYFDIFKNYAEEFTLSSKSLFISGSVGVGKTYICNSISEEVIKQGYNVVYMTSSNLMQKIWASIYSSFNKMEENKEKYNLILNSDLLIIDDLGSENITDTSTSNLFNLINSRMLLKKPIIISTNIGFDEISRVYDERIFSRIKTFENYGITGDDLRGQKRRKI